MEIKLLQVGPYGTNCYLLCDEAARVCAVIDPGGSAAQIQRLMERQQCAPAAILLTHGHYDHTGAAADLLGRFPGIPVYIHRADYQGVDLHLFPLATQVPAGVVSFYGEGDAVPVGGLQVRVLHTPGHSEGSVTLRCGDALFCGDTLFAGSCGRTDFAGGSVPKMMDSLRRLGRLEGNLAVLPGHMETSTLDRERKFNPYLRHALGSERT